MATCCSRPCWRVAQAFPGDPWRSFKVGIEYQITEVISLEILSTAGLLVLARCCPEKADPKPGKTLRWRVALTVGAVPVEDREEGDERKDKQPLPRPKYREASQSRVPWGLGRPPRVPGELPPRYAPAEFPCRNSQWAAWSLGGSETIQSHKNPSQLPAPDRTRLPQHRQTLQGSPASRSSQELGKRQSWSSRKQPVVGEAETLRGAEKNVNLSN